MVLNLSAQDSRVDSLKSLLDGLGLDTSRVDVLNGLGDALYRVNPDEAIQYATEASNLAEMINYAAGLAMANKNIGLGYYMQGELAEALRYWEPALEQYEELGDKQMVANLMSNVGAIYYTSGKNLEAMELWIPALKMAEELSDSTRISTLLMNIGVIYSEMPSTLDSAINYYNRTIEMGEALGDHHMVGVTTINLGEVYMEKQEYDSALFYFEKSLTILTSSSDIAMALNFIGAIYSERGDYQRALAYREDALEMTWKENAQRERAGILLGLANTYENLENPLKAIEYFREAEILAEGIGLNEELSGAYEGLATNYAEIEDYPNAYKYLSLQNTIDDVIYRIESENMTTELMNSYQMEKKQNEITVLEQQAEIDQLNSKRQRGLIIGTAVFGLLILALAAGLYNRWRYVRRTNQKINEQKQQITDSITYAQRIQSAILPSQEVMEELLPDHFVLYRPKDIVSGDFYWIKEVQDHLVIVGADCTGHGVPGAFMSMLGITMFNDLIGDRCFDAPGAILDRLREKVKEMLVQQGNSDEQKDGMDLAIAVFNKTTKEIHFSGANNPLYIIRRKDRPEQKDLEAFASIDNGDFRLFELKGDKQPIGTHWEETPFRTTSVKLMEQDSFYMFSDGYIDQFGGEARKKFKSMNFKKLLLSVQKESMDMQRQSLEQAFDQWRGPYEQIDDIIVLGVKV
jgi:serine phosphatase RsbU (regulator of sigma subunit)/predicted negative regulator of RcsB-dependent stress response